jgi:RNA polymerase sigma-70 factor (ECF subfamily)
MDASDASLLRRVSVARSDASLEAERDLVERARHDSAAFGELYERYVDAIHTFAYHRLGDYTQAEDVTAETFQRALEHIRGFEWRGVPFSAWLYRIASNVIAARFRRQIPMLDDSPPGDELAEDRVDMDAQLLLKERVTELLTAVRDLPEDQQQVIVLRFGAELRSKEIAYIMERSDGAVKALLHRALEALHKRLGGGKRTAPDLARTTSVVQPVAQRRDDGEMGR